MTRKHPSPFRVPLQDVHRNFKEDRHQENVSLHLTKTLIIPSPTHEHFRKGLFQSHKDGADLKNTSIAISRSADIKEMSSSIIRSVDVKTVLSPQPNLSLNVKKAHPPTLHPPPTSHTSRSADVEKTSMFISRSTDIKECIIDDKKKTTSISISLLKGVQI
ncbi:hypothetical protein BaRGS_00023893 [Batillaria attramentaria]|uniref:Uncharacterized protein n=1 Tax=Batillaria attramentaria TaxID=370345 RepID=A0ABD0KCZ4_9CAEN